VNWLPQVSQMKAGMVLRVQRLDDPRWRGAGSIARLAPGINV